ncbi:hypothetical protein Barb7_02949 [Bacteroidales bacterium Barb7]|nr:hypothetical protein Barb7_02949 [Bacteroidales bacterium Barb7]
MKATEDTVKDCLPVAGVAGDLGKGNRVGCIAGKDCLIDVHSHADDGTGEDGAGEVVLY